MKTKVLIPMLLLPLFLALSAGDAIMAQDYIGSSTCIGCHTARNPDIVAEYQKSGHPYKLNSVSGAPPVYPENTTPGVNTPPNTSWDDFAYVIGGYGWKARFVK